LRKCLETIRELLHQAQGRKLRPIECHDVICHIAEAVLSGGIRRSSLISVFSPDDTEMLYCKAHGNFRPAYGTDPGLNSHRQMANNSAALQRDVANRETFDRVVRVAQENFGDPGFIFLSNSDHGTNPCGEIGLHPREAVKRKGTITLETGFAFCNLCEINGALCEDASAFYTAAKAAAFIGTLQAAYTQFDYLGIVTEMIAKRDALLGIGIMGIMNNPDLLLDAEVLQTGASIVREENRRVAKLIGINPAARLTTIKPGGTAPLEASAYVPVASGIHPHHARRFFRRVTANTNEPPAVEFRRINPHMVETKPDGDWSIVFPQQVDENAVTIKEQLAEDFLSSVFLVYENWVANGTTERGMAISPGLTHNVSATVTLRDNEMADILDTIWENRHRIAAMSFAPFLLDTNFPFAPRQEVSTPEDEARWNDIVSNYRDIDWENLTEETDGTVHTQDPACVGVCDT